jgi:nucleoside-diphosphate-sugar epimerase
LVDPDKLLWDDARCALGGVPIGSLDGGSVLLTGASGLLGAHWLTSLVLAQQELKSDFRIDAVVHRDLPGWLEPVARAGRVRVHVGDLGDLDFARSLPSADVIIHAATYAQPQKFVEEASTTLRLNTVTTFALLDKVLSGGKFLFLSSSEVYSGLTTPPFREEEIGTTNTTHPRACYIEGKRCGEAICFNYRHRGVHAKSARLSLAYGPGARLRDARALNSFIEQALTEGCVRLRDRGAARRTYCYVSDAMSMLWRILLAGSQSLYNVGGVWRTTVAELATKIGHIVGVPVFVGREDCGLVGAPGEVRLDLSRFQSEFEVLDFVSAEIGLARTIAWYEALYRNASPHRP